MATRAIVMQKADSNIYVGYLPDYPAVCAQANSLDQLKDKLQRFKDIFADYCKQSEVELTDENLITL